ncbi:MAG: chemotaxis protein CheX [Candidatus Riflebacteria bacterium]|jgi:chemotaxis protein CheX|nr:chemotaxis protein CheX [Candidatus Riflebacteria bacterium]
MDSRIANQFILASIEVFRKTGNVTLKKTGLEYFPSSQKINAGIATILGVTGDIKGQFIITLNEQFAMKVASAILMGVPVNTYDEVAESAVCELGNMIGGEASRLLHEADLKCDITVPSIVRGKEMEIAFYPVAPMFIVHFSCEWGPIDLILSFDNKSKA